MPVTGSDRVTISPWSDRVTIFSMIPSMTGSQCVKSGHFCSDISQMFLTIVYVHPVHSAGISQLSDRLAGPVVKASTSRGADPGFDSRLRCGDFFPGRVMPVTSKLPLHWLPCQALGVIGSAMGLAGPVSVYCDWVG